MIIVFEGQWVFYLSYTHQSFRRLHAWIQLS